MVQTRKQREQQTAGFAGAAYGLALVAFAYGWLGLHSLFAGFLLGLVVVGLTAGGLYLLRRLREARLRQAGLADLEHMTGEEFEALLQASFRAKGYRVTLTPNGADFGADLILERDGIRTAVQAKHWRTRNVGNRAVQEVVAAKAHYAAGKALVIGTGDFTDQAVKLARTNAVELWDRSRLVREALSAAGQSQSATATVTHAPAQDARSEMRPACPRCGSAMVRRTGRYGGFWGCPSYPACRGTLAIEAPEAGH